MKTMVCLISDQHIPNLLTVHSFKPDRLIMIVTPNMDRKKAALYFLDALRFGGLDYNDLEKHRILSLKDENSVEAAKDVFVDLNSEPDTIDQGEWIINITGGTKPMSIAAFEFFKDRENATIFYVPIADQRWALNFSDGTIRKMDHEVTISQFLEGYGFEVIKDEFEEGDGEDFASKWFDISSYLVEKHKDPNVSQFLKRLSGVSRTRNGRKNGLQIDISDNIVLNDDQLFDKLIKYASIFRTDGGWITGKLQKEDVEFLTGGWLEAFLWHLLKKYSKVLGIREVRLNLEIGRKGSREPSPRNEWDITFMQGQSLCFIECKTGAQKNQKASEILYKVEAIKQQLGAIRVKSYLATTSDIILEKKTRRIDKYLATRAALYNCNIISGDQLLMIEQEYHNNSPEIVDSLKDAFNFPKEAAQ